MAANLGLIEGYYGEPWGEESRERAIAFLAGHGYRFFIYAPKADEFLRKRWREPHPLEWEARLRRLSEHCKAHGVSFGLGLSPFELYRQFDNDAKTALSQRLELFDRLGVAILAILFDDTRGDVPGLAMAQARIVHWSAGRTKARRIVMCPTYYTDDPVLDRVFGERPKNYLEDLGRLLDPAIEVFWTGEEVCAREFSVGHLERVGGKLRRRPFLWDNYPVNDGSLMSQFLHLRAFTGRPAAIAPLIGGHAINPALQPTLSQIPALTLAESYRLGENYSYGAVFFEAAKTVLGETLARLVRDDLRLLQDLGLDGLGEKAERLRERYAAIEHPGAQEIVAWLDGKYRFAGDMA